jgi:hypothetical protein
VICLNIALRTHQHWKGEREQVTLPTSMAYAISSARLGAGLEFEFKQRLKDLSEPRQVSQRHHILEVPDIVIGVLYGAALVAHCAENERQGYPNKKSFLLGS